MDTARVNNASTVLPMLVNRSAASHARGGGGVTFIKTDLLLSQARIAAAAINMHFLVWTKASSSSVLLFFTQDATFSL